jgi:hypothetical protein
MKKFFTDAATKITLRAARRFALLLLQVPVLY